MPTSPALAQADSLGTSHANSPELTKAFIDLIEKISLTASLPAEDIAEEILVDTEVDGSRYLLVRLPRPARCRVQLSPREQEIVRMVAKGHPNKVIADVLSISMWTVCTHLRRVFAKLGVGSRAAMVAQLLEMGVLDGDHHRHFSSHQEL
jgi:DNA-binding CsgD family transcriptional regulator